MAIQESYSKSRVTISANRISQQLTVWILIKAINVAPDIMNDAQVGVANDKKKH